jgi:hypothetical protein
MLLHCTTSSKIIFFGSRVTFTTFTTSLLLLPSSSLPSIPLCPAL